MVKAGCSMWIEFRHFQCIEVKSTNNKWTCLMSFGQLEDIVLSAEVQFRFADLLSNSCIVLSLNGSLYFTTEENRVEEELKSFFRSENWQSRVKSKKVCEMMNCCLMNSDPVGAVPRIPSYHFEQLVLESKVEAVFEAGPHCPIQP